MHYGHVFARTFDPHYTATIGMDFVAKVISLEVLGPFTDLNKSDLSAPRAAKSACSSGTQLAKRDSGH